MMIFYDIVSLRAYQINNNNINMFIYLLLLIIKLSSIDWLEWLAWLVNQPYFVRNEASNQSSKCVHMY